MNSVIEVVIFVLIVTENIINKFRNWQSLAVRTYYCTVGICRAIHLEVVSFNRMSLTTKLRWKLSNNVCLWQRRENVCHNGIRVGVVGQYKLYVAT